MDDNLERQYAWAAGLIDGDGCICLYKKAASPSASVGTSIIYTLRIQVTLTHKPTLDRLLSLFGVGTVRKSSQSGKHKQAWVWLVSSKAARSVLMKLKPYAITKLEEMNLADQFALILTTQNGRKLSSQTLEAREAIYQQMTLIKKASFLKSEFVSSPNLPVDLDTLNPNFLAWLAGLFDAEGCVGIKKGNTLASLQPWLSIGITHAPTLNYISSQLKVKLYAYPSKISGYKTMGTIKIKGLKLRELCAALIPLSCAKVEELKCLVLYDQDLALQRQLNTQSLQDLKNTHRKQLQVYKKVEFLD